jgi:hypothetical protein
MVSDDEHQLATVVVELANAIKSLNESNEKRHLEMVSLLKPGKRSPRRRPDTQRINWRSSPLKMGPDQIKLINVIGI